MNNQPSIASEVFKGLFLFFIMLPVCLFTFIAILGAIFNCPACYGG